MYSKTIIKTEIKTQRPDCQAHSDVEKQNLKTKL